MWMPEWLFGFQAHLAEWNIRKGRSATYADCGLGKGPIQIVWAKNMELKTQMPVLILAPLAVSAQFVREGEKFGVKIHRIRDGTVHKGINVTNYEQMDKLNPRDFGAVSGDEAGVIKHATTKTRKRVTEFFSKIQYRLLCTATPAPNDWMELGSSAEALGVMSRARMLSTFFTHEGDDTQQWSLKGHAARRFWGWVCTWARALRKPSDLGFPDDGFILPKLTVNRHELKRPWTGGSFAQLLGKQTLNGQQKEKRKTTQERCEKVAELVKRNGGTSVVWCQHNDEGDLLEELIPGAVQVSGGDSDRVKEERFMGFAAGDFPVLVTKSKIGGWGLNWQHCNHMTWFVSHCYDAATEVLTKRGWLSFGDVNLADEVATVNQETLAFEWQCPTDVIWAPYVGPMIHFTHAGSHGRSFDLLVTPNHRMFVRRCPVRHPNSSVGWEIKLASELLAGYKRQEYRLLSVPKDFVGVDMAEVILPAYSPIPIPAHPGFNKSGNRRGMAASVRGDDWGRLKVVPKLTIDQFIRLAGWYLTEGYCGCRAGVYDGQVTITQTDKNPEYRREIIALLESISGLTVHAKTKDIRCCSMQLALFLVRQFGAGSHNKCIPRWVKELAPNHLTLLRDTMLKGDGCSARRGGEKRCYRTVSKRLADDFAEICLKTGVRGSVQYREYRTGPYAGSGCWDVNIARQTLEPSIHQRPRTVHYHGMIGCVTVPNGTVIVRRNGIPVVSGNSFEAYYQAVRRCWRFGQQRPVTVDVVLSQGERQVMTNMVHKERQAEAMYSALVAAMSEHQNPKKHTENGQMVMQLPGWLS